MKPRHWVYLAVFVVGIGVAAMLMRETMSPHGEWWHAATFFGSILVTVGWVVTSEVSVRNSKKQHTITLITQQQFDQRRIENRNLIRKTLQSYKTKLTPAIANFDDEQNTLLMAIDQELDFYEFIAAGVFRDDLDERLLLSTLKTRFLRFYEQYIDYISHWQRINASTWENATNLYRRWQNIGPRSNPELEIRPAEIVAFYALAFLIWVAIVAIFEASNLN